jgi:membrane-bound lytic murein transglycosylase D
VGYLIIFSSNELIKKVVCFMKKFNPPKLYTFVLGFFVALPLFFLYNNILTKDSSKTDDDKFPQGYRIISPHIPDKLDFAGEEVPLYNFEVKERMDREFIVNTYFHSFTIISMKRANRYFPVIEPILKEHGIPDDFKYVAVIESGLSNVISPAGAVGYWQFLESAGRKYGLEINDEVDQRYDLRKSTEAACSYIKDAYDEFGNWTMAAASFNMGTDGVEKQMARQKTNNYYNLVLSEETSRYIARIIAMKTIFQHPQEYGFDIDEDDLYLPLPTHEITISGPVNDLADFAIARGINYKILKMYNPWLRDNVLTNEQNKTYTIELPVEGSIKVIDELEK